MHTDGVGVYGLYYFGDYELYAPISEQNRATHDQPIYIGMAISPGRRLGPQENQNVIGVLRRLREHAQSINAAINLKIEDFQYRFSFPGEINKEEEALIELVEAMLIKKFQPIWNSLYLAGFGTRDPGLGRYSQQRSSWDTLHPGRVWAQQLRDNRRSETAIVDIARRYLAGQLSPTLINTGSPVILKNETQHTK